MNPIPELYKKLLGYHKKKWHSAAAKGLYLFTVSTSLLFLLFTLIELFAHGGIIFRSILFWGWCGFSFWIGLKYIAFPLLKAVKTPSESEFESLAITIGNNISAIADKLINALQLQKQLNNSDKDDPFTKAAIHQLYTECAPIDIEESVATGHLAKHGKIAIAVGITCMLGVLLIPPLQQAAGRIFLFTQNFTAPAKYKLVVVPGDIRIAKGGSADIGILIFGGTPSSLRLHTKDMEQSSWQQLPVYRDSLNEYRFTLKNIRTDVAYFAEFDGIESKQHRISVFDYPVIQDFHLRVIPPSYSGLSAIELKDNGSFQCLTGSIANISISGSKPLKKAELLLADSIHYPLTVLDNKVSGQLRITKDLQYRILLTDEENVTNENPVLYTIKVIPDLHPSMTILEPEKSTVLSGAQRVPVVVKLQDDFGFSNFRIFYRLSASRFELPQKEYTILQLPFDKMSKEQVVNYIWNVSTLSLATEDIISYYFEAADNDAVNGPKIVRSEEYSLRVPTLQELLKKSDVAQEKQQHELKQALREANELKQELEKLSKDLKKDKKDLSYEEKERVKEAVEKFENLQQKIENSREQIKKNTEEMQQNNLLSKETLQKYMELQDILKEMSSDEMKRAMEKMQQQLQNLDRKQIQQSLEKMKFDEDAFQKSIERTMNLLKRVQIEQKLDELVKRTEQLEQEQSKLAEESNKPHNQAEQKQLENQQKEIGKKLDQMQEAMKELAEKMKNFKDLPNEQLSEMQQEFDQQNNEELSELAEQAMKNNKPNQAQQKQNQISKNMQKLKQNMKSLQSAMMQQQQMKTFQDMARLLNDLLQLSKEEEELKEKSAAGEKDMSYTDNARKQEAVKRNLDNAIQNLNKIAQKTFAVTPEMGKELGNARHKMDQAINSLQSKNGSNAASQQGEAMKSLNEAASQMKSSMSNMMQQGGQGSGMMSMMQQLGKLSGQQMQLNNQTQQMMQGNSGQMSQQQMGEMQRLAQQQEMIKKSLDQLEKEARSTGQSKKLPGNMNEISKQMDEVISDMRTQKTDDQFLQKQEKILSKLLDIQRSINERDFEKERESFTGTNVNRTSPADLKNQQKKKDALQDAINRAQQEGYVRDYEELIKKYFEKVQKEPSK